MMVSLPSQPAAPTDCADGPAWPVDDLADFQKVGLAIVPKAVSREGVAAARAWLEAANDLRAAVPASYEAEFEPAAADGAVEIRKLRRLLWNDPGFWRPFILTHGIADTARRFIGERVSLVFSAAFMKPAHHGSEVVLHQDQALWSRDYPRAVNIWMALSPVGSENGGLVGIPRAGRQGLLPHVPLPGSSFHPGIDWQENGLARPQPIDLDPGDLACWDRFFVHGSGPNLSAVPRRGVVFVFVGTECAEQGARDRADF